MRRLALGVAFVPLLTEAAVWAGGWRPVDKASPRPFVILEGIAGERVRVTLDMPGKEKSVVVVKALPGGGLVTTDSDDPGGRGQGLFVHLRDAVVR